MSYSELAPGSSFLDLGTDTWVGAWQRGGGVEEKLSHKLEAKIIQLN